MIPAKPAQPARIVAMSPPTSAGLLPFREGSAGLELFVVHMGGPYWAGKDLAAWSVAKGLYDAAAEDPVAAARREFEEEVGRSAPTGPLVDLGELRMPSRKRLRVFAVATDEPLAFVASNTFTLEWPPRSGRTAEFPEVDNAAWFGITEAREKLVAGQLPVLDALERELGQPLTGPV
jgi:predicted NUDIX family NTP pyrophosphohydrolase